MIYAIPHNHDCVANHFMKAAQFTLFDDNKALQSFANPAAEKGSSCRDKGAAMQLIKQHQAEAVIVRNIGERALGKLLHSGIRVFQVSGKTPLHLAIQAPLTELTDASQARPSVNHHKKGGCCSGSHDKKAGHACGCGGHSQGEHHHAEHKPAQGTGCSGRRHAGQSLHNPLVTHPGNQHGKKRAIRGLRSGILSPGRFK